MAINKSKFWDEALETAPREVLEANQLKDLQEIVKLRTIILLITRDLLMRQA